MTFTVVLRGYQIAEVDRVIGQADEAIASDSATLRATARETLRTAAFAVRFRGYDRSAVDEAVRDRLRQLSK